MDLYHLRTNKLIIFVQNVTAKFRCDLLVLALYLILTLILLYPFSILKINSQLIGFDTGDSYQGLWSLWWANIAYFPLQILILPITFFILLVPIFLLTR